MAGNRLGERIRGDGPVKDSNLRPWDYRVFRNVYAGTEAGGVFKEYERRPPSSAGGVAGSGTCRSLGIRALPTLGRWFYAYEGSPSSCFSMG
jgi:hypothetical protein